MKHRVISCLSNGRHAYHDNVNGYDDAESQITQSNHWSSTENSSNNAWNVNFGSGNVNNNNKNNSNVVRPVAAADDTMPIDFLQSVYDAYYDCLHGKLQSKQCIEYTYIAHKDVPILAHELWTDTYSPSTSTCFLVSYPKWREVFAANFRDRIVHHWICQYLEPLFEQRFVEQGNVSFNCRKDFGTIKATDSVYDGITRVSSNYQKDAWIFKGDLVGFFMSIDKNIMWRLISKFITRKYKGPYANILLRATEITIFHRPETNCVLNSPTDNWQNLSCNKSLFRNEEGKGMAIGNLTTQLFANFYMSYFDSYVQFIFRHSRYHYARFVDDFVIICDDQQILKSNMPILRDYLDKVLGLTLHKKKHYYQHVSHGVNFVGSVMKYGRTYLSNRTLARMQERIHGFNKLSEGSINTMDIMRIQSVINSYLGFCHGKRTYKRRKELLLSLSPNIMKFFYIEGHYAAIKIKTQFKPIASI